MAPSLREVLAELARGRIPRELPEGEHCPPELASLVGYLQEVQAMALSLAAGKLSHEPRTAGGTLLGSLKSLQSSLRHLSWQTQQISRGDFTQRVEFMGEFSAAFNCMVERLAASRAELEYASTHDGLTGLHNRAFFTTEFQRLAHGRHFPVSVLVVDLDGLKQLNDSQGHTAGDGMITAAAHVLRGSFRADDVVARLGGDEFAVILQGADDAAAPIVRDRLARRVAAANAQPGAPPVAMSVGTACAHNALEMQDLIQRADDAMYADKLARKGMAVRRS